MNNFGNVCPGTNEKFKYITGMVTRSTTLKKAKKIDEQSRREGTLAYHLPLSITSEEKVQVCKSSF